MANVFIEETVLTDIGDAIRSKTGKTNKMLPSKMPDEIASITTGSANPSLQSKTISPSESVQTVSPDSGYDGLSSVTVNAISSMYVGSSITQKPATTYTPGTSDQTIESGVYLTGDQTIKGDANLIPANIKNGVPIFNVTGNYTPSSGGGGLIMKTGTVTNSVDIVTGLSSIKFLNFYKTSIGATGMISASYNADEGTARHVYCSSYSSYMSTCSTGNATGVVVNGGIFTWPYDSTSNMGMTSNAEYTWFAFGEE